MKPKNRTEQLLLGAFSVADDLRDKMIDGYTEMETDRAIEAKHEPMEDAQVDWELSDYMGEHYWPERR